MNTASLIDDGYFQAFFSDNAVAQASRKSSPRVTNEAVQKAVSTLMNSFSLFMPFKQLHCRNWFYLTKTFCSCSLRLLL